MEKHKANSKSMAVNSYALVINTKGRKDVE